MTGFAGGPKTGHKCKLYYNSGTSGTPVWVLVDEVEDVGIPDLSRSLAELKRRSSEYTKNLASLINTVAVEFNLHHGLDQTKFNTIVNDFFNGTPREWAVMDGDISTNGQTGLRGQYLVENFPWNQALEDVSGHEVRLASAYMLEGSTELEFSWLQIGSGS